MVSSRTTAEANPPKKKGRKGRGATISKAEKDRLFQQYVAPWYTTIKGLVVKYTDHYQDVDDNYNYALTQLYAGIHTYHPDRPLKTWIYIVVKRACFNQNKKRASRNSIMTDIEFCSSDVLHQNGNANIVDAGFGSLFDNLSDEVYNALLSISPHRLSPFLQYVQGISIREIARTEVELGNMQKKSEDVVKSRIYWARKQLRYILKQYGISRASYTSESRYQ